jgi:hypothetical protein
MTINRELWLKPFHEENTPAWNCPNCKKGNLRSIENGFLYHETRETRADMNKKESDPEDYKYRYTLFLKCDNENCQEVVTSCGEGFVIEEHAGWDGSEIVLVFAPRYFYPALELFVVPRQCPDEVKNEIRVSFSLFFSDPPASANYARKAVDAILTDKKIKRFTINQKGKKQRINLHDRIVAFQSRQPEVAKKLFAIKWLGNEGSHTDNITKNDVLDAYEILEVVIEDLYVGHRKLVEKKVEKINKSKKPLHPST